MVIPVALRARELGLCEPLVMALTTARPVARAAGLKTVGFSDFARPEDAPWLARGEQMAAQLSHLAVDGIESAAYLGLSFADLVAERGLQSAESVYREEGRGAFLPVRFMERVLEEVRPQIVCATNSPRAERAAIMAAGNLSIPSVCMVDLFAIDEKRWIGQVGFADRVCVLNGAVKRSLVSIARRDVEVVVTGNPAFDRLCAPVDAQRVADLRNRMGHAGRRVLLWASHVEPVSHPWRPGVLGNALLPGQVLQALVAHLSHRNDWILAVRPHPSEAPPTLSDIPHVVLTGQDWPLAELLHMCDAVCTLVSTVGLEAHLMGKPVIQVTGSLFEDAAPYARMGIALSATLETLGSVIDNLPRASERTAVHYEPATEKIVQVLRGLVA